MAPTMMLFPHGLINQCYKNNTINIMPLDKKYPEYNINIMSLDQKYPEYNIINTNTLKLILEDHVKSSKYSIVTDKVAQILYDYRIINQKLIDDKHYRIIRKIVTDIYNIENLLTHPCDKLPKIQKIIRDVYRYNQCVYMLDNDFELPAYDILIYILSNRKRSETPPRADTRKYCCLKHY